MQTMPSCSGNHSFRRRESRLQTVRVSASDGQSLGFQRRELYHPAVQIISSGDENTDFTPRNVTLRLIQSFNFFQGIALIDTPAGV